MFFKKKKDINDDILSQIKAKITDESGSTGSLEDDLLASLMDTSNDVAVQNNAAAQTDNSNEDIEMLNSMVADVISKNNQEQDEIESISEDDILDNDLLNDATNNVAPVAPVASVATETQNAQSAAVSDDDLLGENFLVLIILYALFFNNLFDDISLFDL